MRRPFGSAYLDGPYVEQFVAQHWQSVPGPTVIKAHMIGPMAYAAISSGQARAVCTYRDPRDCVASDVVFMGQGLDYSINRVANSLEFLRPYQSTPNILLVKYEEMMVHRLAQIRRIAAHLGVPFDEAMVQRVDSKTNLQSSKKVCEDLKNRPANQVLNIASHKVDPTTHLHEHHIGTTKTGRWKEEFSLSQARWLTEYFAPWLLQLGYETPDSLNKALAAQPAEPLNAVATEIPMQAAPRNGRFTIGAGLLQSRAG